MKGAKLPQQELMNTAELAKVPSETVMSINPDEAAQQERNQDDDDDDPLLVQGSDKNEQVLSQETRLNS